MNPSDNKSATLPTINGYFVKTNIACRLSNDMIELIDENFELITGGIATITDRKLVECLLDLAMSKVKPNTADKKRIEELVSTISKLTADNETITAENNELKQKIEILSGQNENLGTVNTDSDEKINELNSVIEQLKTANIELSQNIEALTESKQLLENFKSDTDSGITAYKNSINEKNNEINKLKSDFNLLRQSNNAIPEGGIIVVLTKSENKVISEICLAESERLQKLITPDALLKNVFFFILVKGPHDVFSAPISLQKLRELSEPQQPTT